MNNVFKLENNNAFNTCQENSPHHAVVDTGCSANTLREDAPVCNHNTNAPTQTVGTPTGHVMNSSASALIKNKNLPDEARKAHLYPELKYKSLMSVGQLCDAGFAVVFRKNKVEIVKNKDALVKGPAYMTGYRNINTDYLWVTDINEENNNKTTTKIKLTANSVYALKSI